MNKEEICNDGRCKKVRMGEEHPKHLNGKKVKKSDKNDTFRNSKRVQFLFYGLVILGGIITFLANNPHENDPLKNNPIIKIALTTLGLILIGLAFAVLNRGSAIHTEDRIRRIESKLDKILEHRDDVFQNK